MGSVLEQGRRGWPAGRPCQAQQRQPPLQLLERCWPFGELRAAINGQRTQAA